MCLVYCGCRRQCRTPLRFGEPPNFSTNSDRKLFDIKLLVFRRKSHRNFLFYTRGEKNYFHIRLARLRREARLRSAFRHVDSNQIITVKPWLVVFLVLRQPSWNRTGSVGKNRRSHSPRPGFWLVPTATQLVLLAR